MGAEESGSGRSRDTLHDDALRSPDGLGRTLGATETGVDVDDDLDPFGDLAPGATLGGRYLLESVIGKGATGVVFEASHVVIGKKVALKCLYPQHSSAPIIVERFLREAKIAATVEHPNVIQVFDGGREGGVLFLAMERLRGESLGDRLGRGPLPIQDAVELFLGIMGGVAAVHERGVVHRDLKPDNIFLAEQRGGRPVAKVLDFGISKLKEPGLRELTTHGMVMGTPYYMAPEQIANTRDVDARADVYSLGVMLYEALVGDVPYGDESLLDVFRRAQRGDRAPFERLRAEVPAPLARVVERAMRPERDDRFASVTEMREALSAARSSDTEPSAERAIPDDQRLTVQDVPSPLALEELETPASVDVQGLPAVERRTVPLVPAPAGEAPRWVWWVLASAAAITVASLLLALLAIVT